MPPHCDTLDGPVVGTAERAIKSGNVDLILPWVPEAAETELKRAFKAALAVRTLGKDAAEVADRYFFETVVRLHRAGEGAPYTGLKPAGLDTGPVIPRAEKAIEKGDPKDVIDFLSQALAKELTEKFDPITKHKDHDEHDVPAARAYVEAMLGFMLYAHGLYLSIKGGKHHGEGGKKKPEGHEH